MSDEENTQPKQDEAKVEEKPNKKTDVDFVEDIPLTVHVELGRADLTLKELLTVKVGTVFELEKLAGEPMDMYINNRIVARGEVIVINEKYGIRLSDLVHHDAKEGS